MDFTNLFPVAQVGSVFGLTLAAAALFVFGRLQEGKLATKKALAEELARRKKQLVGAGFLRDENEPWIQAEGHGQTSVISVATAGANLGRKVGLAACHGSAAAFFGQKLLAETDDSNTQTYLNAFALRPEWTRNVIPVSFRLIPGGLPGCTPSQAMRLASFWQGDGSDPSGLA